MGKQSKRETTSLCRQIASTCVTILKMSKYYITAAIPYVNAKPHIGHALEFIQTDTLARLHRALGDDTKSLCGGDENALKNVQAADAANEEVQPFVDKNEKYFFELTKLLNVQFDVWQKGSDQLHHFPASQKLWELCAASGDIYKKTYTGLYCVGCEAFYTKEELDEKGECFEHPGKKLQEVSEENYFFKLSKYEAPIREKLESGELVIVPEKRKNEMLSFLNQGLEDISISRSNERARNWGVPVPGDNSQRMYVWFDALNIYQSGIGFGWDNDTYTKYWPADAHVIGKGILRFHAIYWPAFLLSAGLPLPKKIYVHEYFTVDGQKMSKTLGNVYDPAPLVKTLQEKIGEHGADVLRYFCLAKISPFQDGDFSEEKLFQTYTSDLSNGLGNLVSRVAAMAKDFTFEEQVARPISDETVSFIESFQFDHALKEIWARIAKADQLISEKKIWTLTGEAKKEALTEVIEIIRGVAVDISPFMPETSRIIKDRFEGASITPPGEPLFPRVQLP